MKTAAFAAFLALAGSLAGAPAQAAPDGGGQRTLAQGESRCGIPPMKPMSCLNGAWVCRCRGSGQICDWDLIGCETAPGAPRRPGETRPGFDWNTPSWPDTPQR
jgi:hypothetical protein